MPVGARCLGEGSVPTEAEIEAAAGAIKSALAGLLDAKPLLGDASSGDWHACADAGSIDLGTMARGALEAAERVRLDTIINDMNDEWRRRWCDSGACACVGCANNSGGLRQRGYTKEDWKASLVRLGLEPEQ